MAIDMGLDRTALDGTALTSTVVVDAQLLRSIPLIAARIHEKYPEAPLEQVRRSIDDALVDFRDASIPQYLAILVERSATDALRRSAACRQLYGTQ